MGVRLVLAAGNAGLIKSWSGGAVVLLSSDAQQSQNADALPKINNQISSHNRSSVSIWPCCSEKSNWSVYTTFDISLPWCYWSNRCASSAVWVPRNGFLRGASMSFPLFWEHWDRRRNQFMCDSSWNWTERRWFSFNHAKVFTKWWKCMCWLYSLCCQPIAFSHNDK